MVTPKVFVRSMGEVTLQDFVGAGGQADVYAKSGKCFKIYHDPKQAIPLAKIDELRVLDMPNILGPREPILDTRTQRIIGYMMPELLNAQSLPAFLVRTFKDKHRITPDRTLALVRKLQETWQFVHSKGILVVDGNEMNFVFDDKFSSIYFLDVDSYQTKSFPATAIMVTVRDPQTSVWSELTDWYSFAIISFSMFIGIHPYKGKYKPDRDMTMEERMKRNISFLRDDVRAPNTLPFSVVPQVYMDWYNAVLERGDRALPPFDLQAKAGAIATVVHKIIQSAGFDVEKLLEFDDTIVSYLSQSGVRVTQTTGGVFWDLKGSHATTDPMHIAVTTKYGRPAGVRIVDGNVEITDLRTGALVQTSAQADAIMSTNGKVFVKYQNELIEVGFFETGPISPLRASLRAVGHVMPKATQLFEGVAIQNMLKACYVSLIPDGTVKQVHVRELDGLRIIDAKFDKSVLIVVAYDGKIYDEHILRFDKDFRTYDVRRNVNISYAGINFVVLENGIVVRINADEEVEIFSSQKGSTAIKKASDPAITGDGKLFHDGVKVFYARGNTLWSLSSKK